MPIGGRELPEPRPGIEDFHKQRRLGCFHRLQGGRQQPVLGHHLEGLNHAGGKFGGAGPCFRSLRLGTRSCNIGPRILAAATASWIARLMPTPPIGDMAWAASPIREDRAWPIWSADRRHGQQLDLVEIGDGRIDAARGKTRHLFQPLAEAARPSALMCRNRLWESDRRIASNRCDRSSQRAARPSPGRPDRRDRPSPPAIVATTRRKARPDPSAAGRICRATSNGVRPRRW